MQDSSLPRPRRSPPLYQQLHDQLAERFAGHQDPRQKLPSEEELAREYGVSLGTVRKALNILKDERVVVRRHGHGTRLRDPTSPDHASRFDAVRDCDGNLIPHRYTGLGLTRRTALRDEAPRLRIKDDQAIYELTRIRHDRRSPFMRERAVVPVALFPDLESLPNPPRDIVALAHHYGLFLGKAIEHIFIDVASRSDAAELNIELGKPIFVLDRIVHTLDGRPAEWRVARCNFTQKTYIAGMA